MGMSCGLHACKLARQVSSRAGKKVTKKGGKTRTIEVMPKTGALRALACEAMEERWTASDTFDKARSHLNTYGVCVDGLDLARDGRTWSGHAVADYIEDAAPETDARGRRLRADAAIGAELFVTPGAATLKHIPEADRPRFWADALDGLREACGYDVVAYAIHRDEGEEHLQAFATAYDAHTGEWVGGGVMSRPRMRSLHKEWCDHMRARGWDIDRNLIYDPAEVAAKIAHIDEGERAAEQMGIDEVRAKFAEHGVDVTRMSDDEVRAKVRDNADRTRRNIKTKARDKAKAERKRRRKARGNVPSGSRANKYRAAKLEQERRELEADKAAAAEEREAADRAAAEERDRLSAEAENKLSKASQTAAQAVEDAKAVKSAREAVEGLRTALETQIADYEERESEAEAREAAAVVRESAAEALADDARALIAALVKFQYSHDWLPDPRPLISYFASHVPEARRFIPEEFAGQSSKLAGTATGAVSGGRPRYVRDSTAYRYADEAPTSAVSLIDTGAPDERDAADDLSF